MPPTPNAETPLSREEYVWTMAYCYTANANDCKDTSTAVRYADRALDEFRRKFNR